MGYAKCEIRQYKKLTENTWSDDYNDIPVASVDLKEGIEATKDTFKVTLINADKMYKSQFGLDDRIALYMWRNKADAESTDLVIDGMITEINQSIGEGGRKLSIKGANRTQYLLGSLVQIPFIAENHKCYEAIQEVINKVNNNNQAISTGDAKYIDGTSSVATTKRDSSAFPDKSFVWAYKPAYTAIEAWSTDEYTEDGGYIYYIDTDNIFHWEAKPSTSSYSLTEGDAIINTLSIQQGSWDVFNAVIVSVGRDCYGHGNHILQYNPISMVDVGTKWKFLNMDSITPDLLTAEFTANPASFDTGSDTEVKGDFFPTSYNYNLQFLKIDSDYTLVEPTSSTVSSDNEFNLQIRRKARLIGRERAQTMLNKYGEVRYKTKIEVNGTLDYVKGNMMDLTCDSHNLSAQKMRIVDIQHRFDASGWTTILNCEEDLEYTEAT